MYVTEVAVQTDMRRSGTGKLLMQGVDRIARIRNVETIFLHVDVNNQGEHAGPPPCKTIPSQSLPT